MPITPLPQFESDLAELEADRAAYEKLSVPTTIVIRYGRMKNVGEFPYRGDSKPGCGSKMVARTHRGLEIGEMLTSTCPNSGCSKSVSRKEMLEYIDNSGGRNYPFSTKGKIVRVATQEDMRLQSEIEQKSHGWKMDARERVERLGLDMKIVDAEGILGGERLTFYYMSEERVDFRELVQELASERKTRIEMHQVGARDEARLTADYERCGQYCCCKNFLKVLKPVSMRSAKVQKATLDPLKISGRCGRLMCCLRYEDQTYEELRKRLPHRKSRVGTPEGDGMVLSTQILTQLALVLLDADGRQVAIPVEELTETGQGRPPKPKDEAPARESRRSEGGRKPRDQRPKAAESEVEETSETGTPAKKRKRRRRRRKGGGEQAGGERRETADGGDKPAAIAPEGAPAEGSPADGGADAGRDGSGSAPKKKRRRRRRRRGGGSGGEGGGQPEGGSGGGESGSGGGQGD